MLKHESLWHDITEGKMKGKTIKAQKKCTCWATWWKTE